MKPEIPEREIQKSILQYLGYKGYVCKRNNAGMMFSTYKGRDRAIKIGEAGWPDIEGMTKQGRYFGLEVKTRKGVLSDNQKRVGERILASGGMWLVVRSVEDVMAAGL
jgi:hypothetical protein